MKSAEFVEFTIWPSELRRNPTNEAQHTINTYIVPALSRSNGVGAGVGRFNFQAQFCLHLNCAENSE